MRLVRGGNEGDDGIIIGPAIVITLLIGTILHSEWLLIKKCYKISLHCHATKKGTRLQHARHFRAMPAFHSDLHRDLCSFQ